MTRGAAAALAAGLALLALGPGCARDEEPIRVAVRPLAELQAKSDVALLGAGDLDGDGREDFVVDASGTQKGRRVLLLSRRAGPWAQVELTGTFFAPSDGIAQERFDAYPLGDLDGDGADELGVLDARTAGGSVLFGSRRWRSRPPRQLDLRRDAGRFARLEPAGGKDIELLGRGGRP